MHLVSTGDRKVKTSLFFFGGEGCAFEQQFYEGTVGVL